MSGEYVVQGKEIVTVIGKCLSIISLGDKAESNSITLLFTKTGITVEAVNSVASYQVLLETEVVSATKKRVSVLPESLIAYAKSHKSLTIKPTDQYLSVTAGKAFSAQIYYIGDNESVDIQKPKENSNISKIADIVTKTLPLVSGLKNRTDQQTLGVSLEWGKGQLEMIVGDTHHAVVVTTETKQNSSNRMVMDIINLSRVMSVGQNFAEVDNRFVAWSDVEYLAVANQSENVFIADTAKNAINEGKRSTIAVFETSKFLEMLDTLISAVEETASVTFDLSSKSVLTSVKTGSAYAKAQLKCEKFSGKEQKISVHVHHLRDCSTTLKEKTVKLVVFNNMLALESKNKTTTCIAAMASVRSKN